jgi:hypothetical protein
MIVNALRYGIAVASALLGLVPSVAAAGEDMTTLCLKPVYPRERYVTIKMGYSKDVGPDDFKTPGRFDAVKDRFWQLSVPDDFVIEDRRASDRAEVSTHVMFDLLYPEMLPVIGVEEEMEHLGIAKFGPFQNKAGLPPCEQRGPLGIADLARKVVITLEAPAVCCRVPLEPEKLCTPRSKQETTEFAGPNIDSLRACTRHTSGTAHVEYYGKLDDQPLLLSCGTVFSVCIATFDLWTWTVRVTFGKDRFSEWQSIVGAVRAFLDSATQSKSDIPGDIK